MCGRPWAQGEETSEARARGLLQAKMLLDGNPWAVERLRGRTGRKRDSWNPQAGEVAYHHHHHPHHHTSTTRSLIQDLGKPQHI